MTLNPPRDPSGATAPCSGPNAEALLVEAVRHRRGHESLDRLQRCVHRKGLDWLHHFQTHTLPDLEGPEAAAWLEALLGHRSPSLPADRQGTREEQAWIEQPATADVDGAIAAMLAEFPELVPQSQPPGFALHLREAPESPPVPEVLPGKKTPPILSFPGARELSPLQADGLPMETFPGAVADERGMEGLSHPELSGSAACIDDQALFEGSPAAAPQEWSAAEIGAALRSGLLRLLSRTEPGGHARLRADRGGAAQAPDPAVAPKVQPPDPLPVVVRLAERQSGPINQEDAAPAPTALADLRAWLPDSSLPRAS